MKFKYLQECYPCSTTYQSINELAAYDLEGELLMLDALEDYDRQIAEKYSAGGGCNDCH